jgi:hypothetical protein
MIHQPISDIPSLAAEAVRRISENNIPLRDHLKVEQVLLGIDPGIHDGPMKSGVLLLSRLWMLACCKESQWTLPTEWRPSVGPHLLESVDLILPLTALTTVPNPTPSSRAI